MEVCKLEKHTRGWSDLDAMSLTLVIMRLGSGRGLQLPV